MDYDVLAFIGRFMPFHVGHQVVVDAALERAKRVAIVLGSHDQPRNARNPFTTAERIAMITAVYPNEVADGRIQFVPQVDHTYNLDRWIAGVQTGVQTVASRGGWMDRSPKIGLIGHSKDHTSFYLKSFPMWGSIEVDNVDGINATQIRDDLFGPFGNLQDGLKNPSLPDAVQAFMWDWMVKRNPNDIPLPEGMRPGFLTGYIFTDAAQQVREEVEHIATYKKQWEAAPYPPTFHTVDAVVVQAGHILLVKRRDAPGKGLWALPGGFLNQGETLVDGMLRELREETRIAVPAPVLRGSIQGHEVFDDPHRSARGRTITTAYHIELVPSPEGLPKIKGQDDAEKARWVPLSDVRRSMLFEDHYDIIETMVGL